MSSLLPPRFELVPLRGALEEAVAWLPAGATVTVTASPTRGLEPTLELAAALRAGGFEVVPHLAARSLRDRAHLEDVLAHLRDADLRRAFVVGGDATRPGPYHDGMALLRAVEALGHRFQEVGVPAYPEGHPDIGDHALLAALRAKQPYAAYMTTQLCLGADALRRWIGEIRRAGVTLPLVIGMPGPVDLARLLRISARIGVAGSARYLRKNPGLVGAVLGRRAFRPDAFLDAIAATVAHPAAGVRGLHLFTFNQVRQTATWWEERQLRTAAGSR